MKKLFIVSAKILGLIYLFRFVSHLLHSILFAQTGALSRSLIDVGGRYVHALLGIEFLVYGIVIWLLLFKTAWLASLLQIPDEEAPICQPSDLLMAALKILGVYLIISSLPVFIDAYVQLRQMITLNMHQETYRLKLIVPALSAGLGVALIIWTQKISKLVLHEKPV